MLKTIEIEILSFIIQKLIEEYDVTIDELKSVPTTRILNNKNFWNDLCRLYFRRGINYADAVTMKSTVCRNSYAILDKLKISNKKTDIKSLGIYECFVILKNLLVQIMSNNLQLVLFCDHG